MAAAVADIISQGEEGGGGGTPNRNSGLWLYPNQGTTPTLAFLLFLWFRIPTRKQRMNCGNPDAKVEEYQIRKDVRICKRVWEEFLPAPAYLPSLSLLSRI